MSNATMTSQQSTHVVLRPLATPLPLGFLALAVATFAGVVRAPVVHAVMIRRPKVLPASATVGQVRAQLRDDHVHMVLLVSSSAHDGTPDHGHRRLTGTLVRDDVPPDLADDEPALLHARLADRTVQPDARVSEVRHRLARGGERRLAVVDADDNLVGLLCLKRHGRGFCGDEDVHVRAAENGPPAHGPDRRGKRRPTAAAPILIAHVDRRRQR